MYTAEGGDENQNGVNCQRGGTPPYEEGYILCSARGSSPSPNRGERGGADGLRKCEYHGGGLAGNISWDWLRREGNLEATFVCSLANGGGKIPGTTAHKINWVN